MYSTDIDFAEEMLTDLQQFSETLGKQNVTFAEIMEKSNVVLLKAENGRSPENETEAHASFNYKFNTLNVLGKILESAALLPKNVENIETLERDHLDSLREYSEQLHANSRKLMVTVDSMVQMYDCLKEQNSEIMEK